MGDEAAYIHILIPIHGQMNQANMQTISRYNFIRKYMNVTLPIIRCIHINNNLVSIKRYFQNEINIRYWYWLITTEMYIHVTYKQTISVPISWYMTRKKWIHQTHTDLKNLREISKMEQLHIDMRLENVFRQGSFDVYGKDIPQHWSSCSKIPLPNFPNRYLRDVSWSFFLDRWVCVWEYRTSCSSRYASVLVLRINCLSS